MSHAEPRPPRSYRGLVQARRGADHSRRPCGDRIVAVAAHHAGFISYSPRLERNSRVQTQPRNDNAAEILRPRSAGAKRRQPPAAGAPGSQTAPAVAQRVVLYEEDSERSAGQALCRFGHLAHRDGFARTGARAGTGGARGRGNSRTPITHDVVAAPQYRPGLAGQSHDRDHVQVAARFSRRRHRQRARAS